MEDYRVLPLHRTQNEIALEKGCVRLPVGATAVLYPLATAEWTPWGWCEPSHSNPVMGCPLK